MINLINFISKNGEKVRKNQKIFVIFFFNSVFQNRNSAKIKIKIPVCKYYILEAAMVSTTTLLFYSSKITLCVFTRQWLKERYVLRTKKSTY